MDDILASVPTITNQKNSNQNGPEVAKSSRIVIKPNQKSGVISKVIIQPPNASTTANSTNSQSSKLLMSHTDQLLLQNNDPQTPELVDTEIANSKSNEKIEPEENSDNREYENDENEEIPEPEQSSKNISPYEKFCFSLLKRHKTNYLLLLSNAYKNMTNQTPLRTRQSKSNQSPTNQNGSSSQKTRNKEISDDDEKNDKAPKEKRKKLQEEFKPAPSYTSPIDPDFLENFFLDVREEEEPKMTSKFSRRSNIETYLPQYSEWERIGQSYLVNPNPPNLFEKPHFVDFFCQSRLKALVMGGEGASFYGAKDEQAPLLASNARLQFSMIMDEYGIEHLKAEEELRNSAAKNAKSTIIDRLAKRRHGLELKIREYNDDVRNIYRPPPIIPYDFDDITIHQELLEKYEEDTQEKLMEHLNINKLWNINSEYYNPPDFCKVPFDQLHFLLHVLRMIEYTSNLTPKHCTHISKAFTLVFPLILKSVSRPEKEFNFIGHKVHYTFFFRLFRLLNRLIEYFQSISLIPCHASFGLIPGIRSDITCITWQKELHKISENIDYGACLSWFLCEMRDISIALTMQISNVVMIKETIKLYDRYEKHHPQRFLYHNTDSTDKSSMNLNYREKCRNPNKIFTKGNTASNATKHSQRNTCLLSNFNDCNQTDKGFAFDDEDDFDLESLMRISCRENKGQDLYMIKFFIDNDGLLSFVVKKPSESDKLKNPIYDYQVAIPPMYPYIMSQIVQVPDDDGLPVYVPEGSTFRFDSVHQTEERFGYSARIDFEPFSTQSHFSLNIPHNC